MIEIWFETHATSLDNEAGLASGHFDVALSPTGEDQARELGARHEAQLPVAVYCSDLARSVATARLAFGDRVPTIVDARLRECDYGMYTRHPKAALDAVRAHYVDSPFPGGESYSHACTRIRSWLTDLRMTNHESGSRIVVIGHRATQMGLEHVLLGVPVAAAVTAPWEWHPGWIYELV